MLKELSSQTEYQELEQKKFDKLPEKYDNAYTHPYAAARTFNKVDYHSTDTGTITGIRVTEQEHVRRLAGKIAKLEELIIFLMDSQEQLVEDQEQRRFEHLREQSKIHIKEIESIFGIDPNAHVDTTTLDGLLKDYVDENQDSAELVRSIRDGYQ